MVPPRLARGEPLVAKGGLGVAGLSSREISPPDGRGVSRGATPGCQGWYPRLARVEPPVAKGGPGVAGLSSGEISPPEINKKSYSIIHINNILIVA